MTLAEWMEKAGVSQAALAARVGISQGQVSRLVAGRRSPGRRVALALERETGGEVKAASWDEPRGKRKRRRRGSVRHARSVAPLASSI
jgi:transcriptional regulator with XRE-family HTH domain